jgi:hypothetical protein
MQVAFPVLMRNFRRETPLGRWAQKQRQFYKAGMLANEKRTLLKRELHNAGKLEKDRHAALDKRISLALPGTQGAMNGWGISLL